MRWTGTICGGLMCLLTGWGACAAASEPDGVEYFERYVRPVLAARCYACHGAEEQNSGLRLDSREGMLAGGDLGKAVVPGRPAESLMVSAIRRDGDLEMPPEEALSEEEVAHVVRWIEMGAALPKDYVAEDGGSGEAGATHWAFQPVEKPAVPRLAEAAWARTPVDAYVGARLEAAGLPLGFEADRRTLVRRVTFDLTGLPPTAAEVEAFVADARPDAYARLVERLLASPDYGVQWARHWLDVARYADTKGYVYAREERRWVHAWVYRDWVVDALNADLRYDEFLKLQIAGDLLSEDASARAALGFLTLGRRFLGVSRDVIDDRIDVVTRGTMGLTVACARCHDHKYDPIPTEDYYSLSGVFQSCMERLERIEDEPAGEAYEAELAKRKAALATGLATRRKEAADRVRGRVADYLKAQLELEKYPEEGFDVVITEADMPSAHVRRWRDWLARSRDGSEPVFAAWHRFAELPRERFDEEAAAVCEELTASAEGEIGAVVAERFADVPESMEEVAERYGALLTEYAAEEADVEGPVRAVLHGADAPCEVPDEAISNIEYFFPTDVCTELWKLQGEVDRWLMQGGRPPAHVVVLADREEPTTPRVLRRGNPRTPGAAVPRRFLEVLSGEERRGFSEGSGRRELAEAIADAENPLTARVIVNRVWMHHFGRGLVTTASDFGTRAERPSHPELLDWLAWQFVEEGWSLKWLHRVIVNSATYRQASRGVDEELVAAAKTIDPENRLLWRREAKRLSFEQLRDATLAATGDLERRYGGRPADLFAAPFMRRRSLYGEVDRQYFPARLRAFDFANPNLHISQRRETTVPQQALFFLNHPYLLERARALAADGVERDAEARVQGMYQAVFQRGATSEQVAAAMALVESAESDAERAREAEKVTAWSYGYGAYDAESERVREFRELPYFSGEAWQGGAAWPDAALGWLQLTAEGGHPGKDHAHAVVRRWRAPRSMTVRIASTLVHVPTEGDGVRAYVVREEAGLECGGGAHHGRAEIGSEAVSVSAGETVDFVVDLGETLTHDEFLWEIEILEVVDASDAVANDSAADWNSARDFGGAVVERLDGWEQLAQVLLAANEFVFVD